MSIAAYTMEVIDSKVERFVFTGSKTGRSLYTFSYREAMEIPAS
jgi:hypothetical protein